MARDVSSTSVLLILYSFSSAIYFLVFSFLGSGAVIALMVCIIAFFSITIAPPKWPSSTEDNVNVLWIISIFVLGVNYISSGFHFSSYNSAVYYIASVVIVIRLRPHPKAFLPALKIIRIASVAVSISVVLQFLFYDQYIDYIYPILKFPEKSLQFLRYAGLTSQVGVASGYIATGLGIVLLLSMRTDQERRLSSYLFSFAMLFSLVLTNKRAAILAVGVSLGLTYLSMIVKAKFVRVIQLLIALTVVVYMLVIVVNAVTVGEVSTLSRLADMFSAIEDGEDLSSGRIELYQESFRAFLTHPIIGIGWEEIGANMFSITGRRSNTHNVYLQLLAETGVIGFIAFTLPMIYTLMHTYRRIKAIKIIADNSKFAISLLAISLYLQLYFLLYGLLGNPLYTFSYLSVYIVGCLMSYADYSQLVIEGVGNNDEE